MEGMLIGPYIRQKRLDKGWTQEYLCEGICTISTLSRIENSERTPSYSVTTMLLQKLGLPAGHFFALLDENDFAVEKLQKKIQNNSICFRHAAAEERPRMQRQILKDLKELEKLGGEDNRLVQQFILSSKAAIGRPEGPYSPDERMKMLLKAIQLTIPRFDLKKIPDFRYSVTEVIIINQIAQTYDKSGNRQKAMDIYSQLLHYIKKNNQHLSEYPRQFCLVAHNYAIDLGMEKQYSKSISLAEQGWKTSIESGFYQFLPGFIAVLAECYFFIGNLEQSQKFYRRAYYMYDTLGDKVNLAIIQKEMKEHLGLELPD